VAATTVALVYRPNKHRYSFIDWQGNVAEAEAVVADGRSCRGDHFVRIEFIIIESLSSTYGQVLFVDGRSTASVCVFFRIVVVD
jgi:hypothetical protein